MCWRVGSSESWSATGFQPSPVSPSPCAKVGVERRSGESSMATNVEEDYSSGVLPLWMDGQKFQWGCHFFREVLLVSWNEEVVTRDYKG